MWARIENGTVAELTDIDPDGRFHASLVWVECGDEVAPGWSYADGEFSEPEVVQPSQSVPASVTMRQARLALLDAGYLDDVNAAIASVGGAALIEWEYAQTVDRASPLVESMGSILDLDDDSIDGLFLSAAAL